MRKSEIKPGIKFPGYFYFQFIKFNYVNLDIQLLELLPYQNQPVHYWNRHIHIVLGLIFTKVNDVLMEN